MTETLPTSHATGTDPRRKAGKHVKSLPVEPKSVVWNPTPEQLRQYAEGRRFVHEVVERVGMSGFNRVWESPVTLPMLSELTDVPAWISRVGAASAITD